MPRKQSNPPADHLPLVRRISIKVDFPADLDPELIRALAHELAASSNAFRMLIEDLISDLGHPINERGLLKIRQLAAHAQINKEIIQKISDALTNEIEGLLK
jgi:hypothetical protein